MNDELFAKFKDFALTPEEARMVKGGEGLASGITGGNSDGGSGSGGNTVYAVTYIRLCNMDGHLTSDYWGIGSDGTHLGLAGNGGTFGGASSMPPTRKFC